MLPIDVLPFGAAHHISIQHPALDSEAAFGEMLPGMAARDGRPADGALIEARAERDKDLRMVTDDFLGGAPLGKRLAHDLDNAAEILPLNAPRPDDGPAVAVEDENTIEPLARDLHQIAHVDKPDLVGRSRLLRTFSGIREVVLALGGGMHLFIEGHQLPHDRVARPIAHGV